LDSLDLASILSRRGRFPNLQAPGGWSNSRASWSGGKTLRARVGIDHRLLFRLEPDCVQAVDLINRRDLEKRIKTL
jgi:hypothetical protein